MHLDLSKLMHIGHLPYLNLSSDLMKMPPNVTEAIRMQQFVK